MSTIARRSLAFVAVLLALFLVTEHGSAGNPERGSARFPLGSHLVEVTSVEGKLVFQRVDSAENLVGEPWFWPESEGSPIRYEEPRLVDKEGALWLVFIERQADGSTRSRAVALTEIFADGFESANTAAWSSTEPAVNLFFESPAQGAAANSASPAIRMLFATPTGIAIAPETLAFTQGGAPLAMSCSPIEGGAECLPDAPFAEGAVHLEATIADTVGHVSPIASRDFTVDTAAPGIVLSSPAEGFLTGQSSILVAGSLSELATLQVGGTTIPVAPDLTFSANIALVEGPNVLLIRATDAAGNESSVSRSGVSDTSPPSPIAAALVTTSLNGNSVSISGAAGAAEGGVRVRWRNTRTLEEGEVVAGADGSFVASLDGAEGDVLLAVAIDTLDRQSSNAYFPVDYVVPPDPTPFAPPLDPTVAYDLGDAISFLYQGENAIQRDVVPGAIEERRIAWIRGKVMQRGGAPLPGVRVQVLGHPEIGLTLTRADGVFDLVVNGGGVVTLDFDRVGFLQVQRQEVMAWRDSTVIHDVVMIGLDPVATTISSDSPNGQVARSTPQDDGDGLREAIVYFPPGTEATMVLGDDTSQPLSTLTVRATEYTVGEEGHESMPGPLPDNVAYTYAVELSADEAIAARAKRVEFSQPVYLYVDSFIPFPVGSPIPVAWYDHLHAIWMPSDNGRVLEILAADGSGRAEIDADGSGSAASPERLNELGFTDTERQKLAQLYPVGHRIWRSPIDHFTPFDCNNPYSPPDDAERPPEPVVRTNDDDPDGDRHDDDGTDDDESSSHPMPTVDHPCLAEGSIIECENQIVREELQVTGTPYQLAYASYRTPGWGADSTTEISLRRATVPNSLKEIIAQVDGQGFLTRAFFDRAEFVDHPYLTWTVQAPRVDAFQRQISGQRRFRIKVGYVYQLVYRAARDEFVRSWARFPEVTAASIYMAGPRSRFTLWRESTATYDQIFRGVLGNWDGRAQQLGGFTFDVHHAYDPTARTLHLGDGRHHTARAISPTLKLIAGSGSHGYGGDGFPATLADLATPSELAFGPNGSLYFSDVGNYRLRVVRPNGIIETVAGNGERCLDNGGGGGGARGGGGPVLCEDGLPALETPINQPTAIAVAADGEVYFADFALGCVRKIDQDGILHNIAGICTAESGGGGGGGALTGGFAGETGPATSIELIRPKALAVRADGSFFVGDELGLSQITPDGILTRVSDDNVSSLAAGRGGDIFLVLHYSDEIYRLAVDGVLERIAGGDVPGDGYDGDLAIDSRLSRPSHLAFGPDERLYFLEEEARVRRIEDDGTLKTIGGPKPNEEQYPFGPPDAGNFLLENRFDHAGGLAIGQGGRIFVADTDFDQIFETELAYPDYVSDELEIAEGNEVFVFDKRGRHLRTRHGLTGAVLQSFTYDTNGLLTAITDANGNITTIERPSASQATIISPFGQRTELTMDASGWLESIENPNHESEHYLYRQGLLIEKYDARGNHKAYEYSDFGRLTKTIDEDQRQRRFSLTSRFGWTDNTVMRSEALGQRTYFTTRNYPDGSVYRSKYDPDLYHSTSTRDRSGATSSYSHGVASFNLQRPDPRLGESAAYAGYSWVEMSPSLRSETRTFVETDLEDPNDPWSYNEIVTYSNTNGRYSSSVYDKATGNLTSYSPEGRMVRLDLDQLARPIHFEAPETELWTASYLETGELEEIVVGSGPGERRTSFGYDLFHRLETIEDAEQRTVTFGYDDANRVTSTLLPDGKAVGFAYDENGNVKGVTPPGKPEHVFTYSRRNQLETYVLPDAGGGTATEVRTYDESKRLKEVLRPDGKLITFTFKSASDRLESITSPRGVTSFSYHPINGMISEIEEPDGQKLSFEYEGTLPTKTTWTGEVNGSVGRTYDENFRVTSLDVNGQDPVFYTYDDDNLLTSAGELIITRDPESGREVETQLGNVKTERTYTSFGEPETYTAKFNETELYYEHYTYNKLGWITDLERRQNGLNELLHYEYDERGRLEEVWKGGALESSYTYDDNSNRLSYTGPLGNATGTYDTRDRVMTYGGASYTWTEAGELLTKTEGSETTTYDYDVFGNLRKVVLPDGIEIEYLTDGAQRRIGKKINGVLVQQWLYQDQLEPIAELDGDGNLVARFVYGARLNVPEYLRKNGSTYRYLVDRAGSPRLLIDAFTGEFAQEIRYDDFGLKLLDTRPGFQPFGFSGGLSEIVSNLVRLGVRDYDSATGRWTTSDPLPFFGASSNQYAYSLMNPVNYFDLEGTDEITQNSTIRSCFYCLFKKASFGEKNYRSEEAAWIIQKDGQISCQFWPSTRDHDETATRGIPNGAIALVHTHPTSTSKVPSRNDEKLADSKGFPIYVIHKFSGITKYDPATKTTTTEEPVDWESKHRKECKKAKKDPCSQQ